MKLFLRISALVALTSLAACAHKGTSSTAKIDKDRENIKAFAGCYKVDFQFVETFPLEKDYKTTKPYRTGGVEVVIVDEDTKEKIGLQHILIVDHGDGKNMALKHWRQDWTYEPSEILEFKGNNTWAMKKLTPAETAGQWLQSVTQVDDSPRYECAAPWAQTGAGPAWECKSWNPLPRREYTKRKDYQVIERNNAQKLTSYGWIHEQDSEKLKLNGDKATAFVKERGENTYTRTNNDECKMAVDWWMAHKDNWKSIRESWAAVRRENPHLKLNFKDQEGDLWKKLFELDDKAITEKWDQKRMGQEAKAAIQSYIVK